MANRYEYKICHLLPTLPTQLLGLLICNTVNNFIFPIQKCIQLVGDNGGSSIVTNVIRSWGMLITEEAVHVCAQEGMGNLCSFLSILLGTQNCSKSSLNNNAKYNNVLWDIKHMCK